MSLIVPTANMVGFAVGSTHLPPEAYMDPSTLHMAFKRAHRLLFSVAIQAALNPVHADATVTGYVQSTLLIVSLVPVFVYLSEALLVPIALLTCYIFYVAFGQRSALFQDPDSLAQIMCLSSDVDLQRLFISYDAASTPMLSAALQPSCFALIASFEEATSLIMASSHSSSKIDRPMMDLRTSKCSSWAIRADLHCLELTETPSNVSSELVFNSNATEIELLASLRQPGGPKIVYVGDIDGPGFIDQPRPWGVQALEFAGGMAPTGKTYIYGSNSTEASSSDVNHNSTTCDSLIVRGWI
jgi:hypothetical protein